MTSNAKLLLLSGTMSYVGSALTRLSNASIFANFTEHIAEFSFFFIALTLPAILFKKVFKYIVDHFEASYLLTFTQLCRSLLLFIQLLFMWNGLLGKMWLCILIFCHSTLHCIFISCLFTHLPTVISEDERGRYLDQSGSWTQVGYLFGVALFMLTSTTVSLSTFLMIDLLAYLFSAFVFAMLSGIEVDKAGSLIRQRVANKVPQQSSNLAIHVAGLPPSKQAFFMAIPVILLEFFFAVSATTALSLPQFKLGTTGLGILETLFRFGVIIVGFNYERFFKTLIHNYRSWLVLLGGACCSMLAIILMPAHSIVLCAINAFFIGAFYSVLITVSRAGFYATQHSSTYSRAIVMVNLIESVGELSLMVATAVLIKNNFLMVLLMALFFTLSFLMPAGSSWKNITKGSDSCQTPQN